MEDAGIMYGHLVNFPSICYIVWHFSVVCGHLVYFVVIWYILTRFGILYREKSGNPGSNCVSAFKLLIQKRKNVEQLGWNVGYWVGRWVGG
jgi:hypothetical protein